METTSLGRLCLNSPGGALDEAILIAREVLRPFRVTTILEEGAECLSACALIFMMGQTKEYDGITVFSRYMHYTARLGFHLPQVRFSLGGGLDEQSISSAFDTALDAVVEFLLLATSSNASHISYIEGDLLARAFEARGADFYLIDRVDQVGRWNIGVFGYEPPEQMDLLGARNVCENLPMWTVGLSEDAEPISIWEYQDFFYFFENQRGDLARDISRSRIARNHYDIVGESLKNLPALA